eukprot:TRINITY_DN1678_c1_g1_i2.p1 TRINITY_DN1678_c1_g1~~TRINITY_DN1678_c1_g1_i2.p1  ORF type:complete len:610 (-),score=96.69 TRINITY_DN1678_c1_g1_i2:577-2406(-)
MNQYSIKCQKPRLAITVLSPIFREDISLRLAYLLGGNPGVTYREEDLIFRRCAFVYDDQSNFNAKYAEANILRIDTQFFEVSLLRWKMSGRVSQPIAALSMSDACIISTYEGSVPELVAGIIEDVKLGRSFGIKHYIVCLTYYDIYDVHDNYTKFFEIVAALFPSLEKFIPDGSFFIIPTDTYARHNGLICPHELHGKYVLNKKDTPSILYDERWRGNPLFEMFQHSSAFKFHTVMPIESLIDLMSQVKYKRKLLDILSIEKTLMDCMDDIPHPDKSSMLKVIQTIPYTTEDHENEEKLLDSVSNDFMLSVYHVHSPFREPIKVVIGKIVSGSIEIYPNRPTSTTPSTSTVTNLPPKSSLWFTWMGKKYNGNLTQANAINASQMQFNGKTITNAKSGDFIAISFVLRNKSTYFPKRGDVILPINQQHHHHQQQRQFSILDYKQLPKNKDQMLKDDHHEYLLNRIMWFTGKCRVLDHTLLTEEGRGLFLLFQTRNLHCRILCIKPSADDSKSKKEDTYVFIPLEDKCMNIQPYSKLKYFGRFVVKTKKPIQMIGIVENVMNVELFLSILVLSLKRRRIPTEIQTVISNYIIHMLFHTSTKYLNLNIFKST